MSADIKWGVENQDMLPPDEKKKLPPMKEEWFDGDKESRKIEFVKCTHDLFAVSAIEVRCKKCSACWNGAGVTALLQSPK